MRSSPCPRGRCGRRCAPTRGALYAVNRATTAGNAASARPCSSRVGSDLRRDPREGGEQTEALLGERGLFVEADASRWDDVDRLVTLAVERYGRLDVMVRNAGVSGRWSKGLLETTEEDWDAIMAVNLRGVFLGAKRAVAEMLGQEPIGEVRGRVVVVSSQHGLVGPSGHVAYAASKGGVVNLLVDGGWMAY